MGGSFSVYMEMCLGETHAYGKHVLYRLTVIRSPFRKGWPQSTRCSPEPEMLEICFITWMSFYLMRYCVLVRSLPLCGTFSKLKCYSCHDYMCCSKARQHFSPTFQSCSFFQPYPEPHNLDFGVYSNRWLWKSGLFLAWQQLSERCGSLTVEHTEHLILAGSNF